MACRHVGAPGRPCPPPPCPTRLLLMSSGSAREHAPELRTRIHRIQSIVNVIEVIHREHSIPSVHKLKATNRVKTEIRTHGDARSTVFLSPKVRFPNNHPGLILTHSRHLQQAAPLVYPNPSKHVKLMGHDQLQSLHTFVLPLAPVAAEIHGSHAKPISLKSSRPSKATETAVDSTPSSSSSRSTTPTQSMFNSSMSTNTNTTFFVPRRHRPRLLRDWSLDECDFPIQVDCSSSSLPALKPSRLSELVDVSQDDVLIRPPSPAFQLSLTLSPAMDPPNIPAPVCAPG
jgi:hypothetical protein